MSPPYNQNHKQLSNIGFCFLPKIFSQKRALIARDALWEIINGNYSTGRTPERRFWNLGDDPAAIIKIDKPHLCNKYVWNLVTNREFGKALAKATNAKKIQVWHSQVVWKPKSVKNKGNAGWHRDAQYWPFWSLNGLYTAWIALSNVCLKSGPVRFIAGSNHWDEIKGMDFFDQNLNYQNRILDQYHKNRKIVDAILKIGEVSIHSSLTYHSSMANKLQKPRVGMVVHFCTNEAKRIEMDGKNEKYLNQINDPAIAPVIYQSKH